VVLLRQYSVSADTGAFEIPQSSSRLPDASTLQSVKVRAARAGTCVQAPARTAAAPCVPVRAFLDIVHAILLRLPIRNCTSVATAGSAALTPWGHSPMGKKNSIQIRHARLNYLAVGLKLKLNGPSDLILVTYPT